MPVMGAKRFERFFRLAATLDVDKADIRRYQDFVNQKIYDLIIVAQGTAKANGRDILIPSDIPVTKGLQESIHAFRELDQRVDLAPLLEQVLILPPLDWALAEQTEARLPDLVGGLSLALARTFRILDPALKNPASQDWEQAFEVFNLLL